ncbi:hypothetical protein PoB_001571700 [Plakobranchus ocellatus]|uniref:Ig-like domain-containing protein n=1 Tax=Plakobranchus ocellatus TaxID=259542 RepID=A0AAV3Z3X8_9GAST|nr:hypothetical protein PoB_001571700 [Plakobranchus ocellatus]
MDPGAGEVTSSEANSYTSYNGKIIFNSDGTFACSVSSATLASPSAPGWRRHSLHTETAPSYCNNYSINSSINNSGIMAMPGFSPPAVTLVDAASDKTTPAITMTMAAADIDLPTSMTMFLPSYGPGMRRFSHDMSREFSLIPNFPVSPSSNVPGTFSRTADPHYDLSVTEVSSITRACSVPHGMDSLAMTGSNVMPSGFSLTDMTPERGFPVPEACSGDIRGFPVPEACRGSMPGFTLPGGGDIPGFPLASISGGDAVMTPMPMTGQEWLLPIEAFFFSGFQCLESLA